MFLGLNKIELWKIFNVMVYANIGNILDLINDTNY
jgi:hypothetical protein